MRVSLDSRESVTPDRSRLICFAIGSNPGLYALQGETADTFNSL